MQKLKHVRKQKGIYDLTSNRSFEKVNELHHIYFYERDLYESKESVIYFIFVTRYRKLDIECTLLFIMEYEF